jgi:predicted Zn-dependent protease
MPAYRDDLEAAVHRAEALEAELRRVRARQREDRAGYLVKVTELAADLRAEQERLREIEVRVAGASDADLAARLASSRSKLTGLASDVAALTAKASAAQPSPRRHSAALFVAGAALAFVASASAVVVYLAVTSSRRDEALRDARAALVQGTYPGYLAGARALERLADDDPALLAEAAWVRASIALEFGTDDDEAAAALVQRARQAGASPERLAPARVAIRLSRGELLDADRVLQENTASTGAYAPELIYLRGLWYLRRDRSEDALRRFAASAEASPGDVRYALAQVRALCVGASYGEALSLLARVGDVYPQNVEARLLEAKILIETGSDPGGGDDLARQVLEEMRDYAAPGQLGWAWLLRARRLSKQLGDRPRPEELGVLRTLLESSRSSRPVRDAEFSSLLASTLLDIRDPSAAAASAEAAVRLAPEVDRYRRLLVQALLEAGDVAGAADQLQGVTLPDEPATALLRGRVALAQGDLETAETAFEAATRDQRSAREARLALGRIHLARYEPDEAVRSLEPVAASPLEDAAVFDLLGDAYAMRGTGASRAAARRAYADALSLRAGDVHALIGIAEVVLDGTNASAIASAIAEAERSAEDTELEPALAARLDAAKARFAHEFQGDATTAAELFARALALDEGLADAHLGLGVALRDLSRSREACEHFSRYLALFERAPEQNLRYAQEGAAATCRP